MLAYRYTKHAPLLLTTLTLSLNPSFLSSHSTRGAALPSRFRDNDVISSSSTTIHAAVPSSSRIPTKRARGKALASVPPPAASTGPASPQAPAKKRGRRDVHAVGPVADVVTAASTSIPVIHNTVITTTGSGTSSALVPRISLLAQPKHTALPSQHGAFLRKTNNASATVTSTATAVIPTLTSTAAPPPPPPRVSLSSASTAIPPRVSLTSSAAVPPPPPTTNRPIFEKMASARHATTTTTSGSMSRFAASSSASTSSVSAPAVNVSPNSVASGRSSLSRTSLQQQQGTGRGSISRAVSASRWSHVAARTDTGRRPSLSATTSAAALSASLRRAMGAATAATVTTKVQYVQPPPLPVTQPPQQSSQPATTFDRHVSAVLIASAREALARAAAGDAAGALSLFAALPASLPAVTGKAVFWVTRAAVLESAGALSSAISCLAEGVAACRDAPPAEQDAVTQALARIASQRSERPSSATITTTTTTTVPSVIFAVPAPTPVSPMPESLPRSEPTPQRASRIGVVSRDMLPQPLLLTSSVDGGVSASIDSVLKASSLRSIYAEDEGLTNSEIPLDVGELAPAPRSPPPVPTLAMRVRSAASSSRLASPPFAGAETNLSVGGFQSVRGVLMNDSGIYGGASMVENGLSAASIVPATPTTPAATPMIVVQTSPLPRTPEVSALRARLAISASALRAATSPLPASPLPIYIASASRAPLPSQNHHHHVSSSPMQPLSQIDTESFTTTVLAPSPQGKSTETCTTTVLAPTPQVKSIIVVAPDSLARPSMSHDTNGTGGMTPLGSVVLLQSVHARASTAAALGAPTFLSPVRRSTRVTPHASNKSLQDANFAWRGNDALPGVSLRSGFDATSSSSLLAASYLRGPMTMDF